MAFHYGKLIVVANNKSQIPPEETIRCLCPNINFDDSMELYNHMIVEHNATDLGPMKKVLCPDCGSRFFKLKRMAKHWEKLHSKKAIQFVCPRCPRLFRTHLKVVRHCEKNHGYKRPTPKENLFCCNVCKLKFPIHSELLSHVRKNHGQEKLGSFSFACSNCPNLAFRKSAELVKHSKAEHGYKTRYTMYEDILEINKAQLEIKKCKKEVKGWSQDIEGKLFICGVCGLDFLLHSELRRHVKLIHQGFDLKFACSICPALPFKKVSKLLQHAKAEHGYKYTPIKESLANVNQSNSTPEGLAKTGKYFPCKVTREFRDHSNNM